MISVMDTATARASQSAPLHRRVLARTGEAYVAICVILAALAMFQTDPGFNPWPFLLLFLATLPGSLSLAWIQYVGGILIFGPEDLPLVARVFFFLMWVALATSQMVMVRMLIRAIRGDRAWRRAHRLAP
jgi:ABC-type polysaccharide/polyol phosphate export permease